MVKNLQIRKIVVPLQRKTEKERAFSSAGSERLPYKQRVGGSVWCGFDSLEWASTSIKLAQFSLYPVASKSCLYCDLFIVQDINGRHKLAFSDLFLVTS